MVRHSITYDPRAWIAWILVMAVVVLLTRNPLYLIILFLSARLIAAVHAHPDQRDVLPIHFGRLALFILPISSLFNALFVHFGETVLFSLPDPWPLIGGIITLEAAVFGLGNGLILLALLATFVTFNQIIPTDALIKLTPKALNDLGIVLLIALTYIPQTQRQLRQVREAQAIRGYEPKGVRGWRPILLPLLIGGLERAMGLAEAMVARGFGSTKTSGRKVWMQAGLAAGLAGSLAGWIAALWVGWPGWILVGAGGLLILAITWRLGLDVVRTQYRPRKWQTADTLLLTMALAVPLIFTIYSPALGFNTYPRLSWPPFDPFVGMVLLLLAAPALLPTRSSAVTKPDNKEKTKKESADP